MASDCQIVNGIGFVPSTAKLELAAEAAPYVLSALLLWCDDDVGGVSSAGPIVQVQAFLDHAARTSKSHPLLTFAIASSTREREPSGPAAGMALQLCWMLRKPRAFLGEAIRSLSHCIAPEEPVYGWRASVVTSPFWCSVRILDMDSGESAWTCTEQRQPGITVPPAYRVSLLAFDEAQDVIITFGNYNGSYRFGYMQRLSSATGIHYWLTPYDKDAFVVAVSFAVHPINSHLFVLTKDFQIIETSKNGAEAYRELLLTVPIFKSLKEDGPLPARTSNRDAETPIRMAAWQPFPSCRGRLYVLVRGQLHVVDLKSLKLERVVSSCRLMVSLGSQGQTVALAGATSLVVHPHRGEPIVGVGGGGVALLSPDGQWATVVVGTTDTPVPWNGDLDEGTHFTGIWSEVSGLALSLPWSALVAHAIVSVVTASNVVLLV
jgi:hypothetical protein